MAHTSHASCHVSCHDQPVAHMPSIPPLNMQFKYYFKSLLTSALRSSSLDTHTLHMQLGSGGMAHKGGICEFAPVAFLEGAKH